MAAEKAIIRSVKNNVITVSPPFLEGTIITYLTADVAASGTALTVKDTDGYANNDYIILGDIGSEQSEIVKIGAAVSAGTSLTVGACTFPHPTGTKVTLIRYNQVAIYGSTSASDAAPTIIGSAEALDVSKGNNEIVASTTYAYYYARYYNSQTTTYSLYSDSVAAGGLESNSRGEIKNEFLSMYNEQIDDLVTDDWLNRAINRWQRFLLKRRRQWSTLRSTSIQNLTEDVQAYSLPTDIFDIQGNDSIVSVKVSDDQEMTYADDKVFTNQTFDFIGTTLASDVAVVDVTLTLTDSSDFPTSGTVHIGGDEITYTGNTKSTGTLTGVTGISATHTSGDEVWSKHTTGTPIYYTIDSDKIKLNPVPNSTYADLNLFIEYWKKFVDLDNDSDTTLFPYPENCYFFLYWQLALRRKLPADEVQMRRAEFEGDLERLVSEDPDFRDILLRPHNMYNQFY